MLAQNVHVLLYILYPCLIDYSRVNDVVTLKPRLEIYKITNASKKLEFTSNQMLFATFTE